METVSPETAESTRKTAESIQSAILRRLADMTQAHAAACMGVSESTVSRMREDLPKFCQLLAAIDLKVADRDSMIVDRSELEALESMALKYLELRRQMKARQEGMLL
ncbi:MAG: CII family transcriptional regulator [Bacillota bacterium]